MHRLVRWLIERHFIAGPPFAGGLPAPLFRAVRRHVDRCAGCREHYSRHIDWERLLPDAESRAGARLLREALALAPRQIAAEQRGWLWGGSLAAVAAAALVVVLLRPAAEPPSLQPRGGEQPAASRLELLLRGGPAGPWLAVDRPVAADSELAFRLDNAERYPWLSLFIVDSSRQVHLLYPARAGEQPLAIGDWPAGALLPDAFSPELAPGAFTAVAIFSRQPIDLTAVERMISDRGLAAALAQWADRGRVQRIDGQRAAAPTGDGGQP